jgi:predicted amidohydrolase
MKISVAQTKPVTGNIEANIDKHKAFINIAALNGADLIIFPELSLTGYEPELARELAIDDDDARLNELQVISDQKQIAIGVGVPLKTGSKPSISMIIFQPNQTRQIYSKKHLHADEDPFFTSRQGIMGLNIKQANIALAICYEISIPQHSGAAFKSGAQVYIASVAKFMNGVNSAIETLASIASDCSMTVLMSNSVGPADNGECAGKTSAWNTKGLLLAQLDSTTESLLTVDTASNEKTETLVAINTIDM